MTAWITAPLKRVRQYYWNPYGIGRLVSYEKGWFPLTLNPPFITRPSRFAGCFEASALSEVAIRHDGRTDAGKGASNQITAGEGSGWRLEPRKTAILRNRNDKYLCAF